MLGYMYTNGIYVDKDVIKAKEYYILGDKQNNALSQHNLASLGLPNFYSFDIDNKLIMNTNRIRQDQRFQSTRGYQPTP